MTDQERLDLSIKIWNAYADLQKAGVKLGPNEEGRLALAIIDLEARGLVRQISKREAKQQGKRDSMLWFEWVGEDAPSVEQPPLWR